MLLPIASVSALTMLGGMMWQRRLRLGSWIDGPCFMTMTVYCCGIRCVGRERVVAVVAVAGYGGTNQN